MMFPNTIEDDFGEFIDAASLEQNKHKLAIEQQKQKKTSTVADILRNDDIKWICNTFTDIMKQFSRSYYYNPKLNEKKQPHVTEYIESYKEKAKIFQQLYRNYDTCLNSRMDDIFYNGVGLVIGISMQNYDLLELNGTYILFLFIFLNKYKQFTFFLASGQPSSYNFYKDPNIAEVLHCTEVLKKIEIRVNVELEQFPEHAGLLDVSIALYYCYDSVRIIIMYFDIRMLF